MDSSFSITTLAMANAIRLIERRVKGGWGVVLDDVLAGVYAHISLRILGILFPSAL